MYSEWVFILIGLYARTHGGPSPMPIIHFLGKIFPLNTPVSITSIPGARYDSADNNRAAIITIKIDGWFAAECPVSRYEPNDPAFLALIHKPVFDLTQAVVSLVSFSRGIGLTLCLDEQIG